MSKSNFQKMIELSHSGSGVDWESIALKCFVLLTDEQIGRVARAEGYLEDEEENSDTINIGIDWESASEELKDYINKQTVYFDKLDKNV